MSGTTSERFAKVSVVAELERIEWAFEPAGEDELRVRCPAPDHNDQTPSASINTQKRVWRCHVDSCGAHGDIATFIAMALRAERRAVLVDLGSRYNIDEIKAISPETVEKFHGMLGTTKSLVRELRERGVTEEMCRVHRIGEWQGRITIPVYDDHGNVVNIRRYLPGAPGPDKMRNTRGYGSPARLYLPEQLKQPNGVWICGGEMKAIVAASILNPMGIGAVSSTAGEGTWDQAWSPRFRGKKVWVCMDVDQAGEAGAKKIASMLARAGVTVMVVRLPLDSHQYPKGDINDWVGREKAGPDEFRRAMETARPLAPGADAPHEGGADDKVRTIDVARAVDPANARRRVEFTAVVSGFFETPYLVPKCVSVSCDRNQGNCPVCPVPAMPAAPDGGLELTIAPTSEALLWMIGAPAKTKHQAISKALRIPPCKSISYSERAFYSAKDVRVSPQLTLSADASGEMRRFPAYVIDADVESNVPYVMRGAAYPHPSDQRAVLLVERVTPANDGLDTYSPTEVQLDEAAAVLRPPQELGWTVAGVDAAVTAYCEDMTANVTGILGRRDMHAMMLLVWHSPLLMTYGGRMHKGWLDGLVLGDSGQGKTEALTSYLKHVGLGQRVECKNATAAGIIGGLQQVGNRWFVTWGLAPQMDRQLLVLDEVKGMQPTEIGKLTDMRSSGIAEIPKIERGKTAARTRMLWSSNTRRHDIDAYTYGGTDAVLELMGSPEDVRRFDVMIVVAKTQVPADVSTTKPPEVPHLRTQDLARRAILYAWTRRAEDVTFEPEAEEAVRAAARSLCADHDGAARVPLLDSGTTHLKVARLAAAAAALTLSAPEGWDAILVRPCHVEWVAAWLRRMYAVKEHGYADMGRAERKREDLQDPESVKLRLRLCTAPRDVVTGLLELRDVTLDDIRVLWCTDSDTATGHLSFLVRRRCLRREGRVFRKTAPFIALLRELDAEELPEPMKPPVIKEEEL